MNPRNRMVPVGEYRRITRPSLKAATRSCSTSRATAHTDVFSDSYRRTRAVVVIQKSKTGSPVRCAPPQLFSHIPDILGAFDAEPKLTPFHYCFFQRCPINASRRKCAIRPKRIPQHHADIRQYNTYTHTHTHMYKCTSLSLSLSRGRTGTCQHGAFSGIAMIVASFVPAECPKGGGVCGVCGVRKALEKGYLEHPRSACCTDNMFPLWKGATMTTNRILNNE